jgi:peptidoglycan hydrolase-like protein with peptidoglycan-binding domain
MARLAGTGQRREQARRELPQRTSADCWHPSQGVRVAVFIAILATVLVGPATTRVLAAGTSSVKVTRHPVTLLLTVPGYGSLTRVSIRLDGRYVTRLSTATGDQLTLANVPLANGLHTLSFTAEGGQILPRHYAQTWRVAVEGPTRTVNLGALNTTLFITSAPATFTGTVAANATVTLSCGAVSATATADSAGAYTLSAPLPDGRATVTLTATDPATGTPISESVPVLVDALAPQLVVAPVDPIMHKASFTVAVSACDATAVRLSAKLNGRLVRVVGPARSGIIRLSNLPQGTCTLAITATDLAGHVTASKQRFLVNSSEKFGNCAMIPGAVGKDVVMLQKCIAAIGLYHGKPTGVYDAATTVAVEKVQRHYGLPVNGRVGPRELIVLGRRIVIDLSNLHLSFYRFDRLVKVYPIAAGQPRYPTPTGIYFIIQMTKNPTWLPPNSDWAKNATPVAPGATNPLGTRWMGTSAPGIGIHGVPASENYTIGTYASHGCIRMYNWNAIDLFSRVVIGTPVIIQR